jgi:hypothetical protein
MDQAVDSLARWRDNIYLISQLIQNDVSSTKVCMLIFDTNASFNHHFWEGPPLLKERALRAIPATKRRR